MENSFPARARRQIIFDLDTKALEIYYPSKSWRGAYDVIERHLLRNGFEHVEGTGYISKDPMLIAHVDQVMRKLLEKNPWLNKCMRDCRQSIYAQEMDMTKLFDKGADIPTREEMEQRESQKARRRERSGELER